jgi:UPF0271 protein
MDLNADLGEGGPCDRELLEVVTSASVACGYHAGDPSTMIETARTAAGLGVTLGAHPSYRDREGFGRRPLQVSPDQLYADVVYQVGAMAAAAVAAGTTLAFVKPHGALYNQACVDAGVAGAVVRAVATTGLALLCPHGSQMQRRAAAAGVSCYTEAFADRPYSPDGTLVGRATPGSVIDDPADVAARAVRLARRGEVSAVDGTVLTIPADSLCIHGDTPGAVELARSVRRALHDAGVVLRPFARP